MARRRRDTLRPFGIAGEPSSILRSTALYRFTEEGAAAALLQTAEMLYDHALEAISWPEWNESALRSELRAAADDLLHCARALEAVASELRKSEVEPADAPLCRLAAELFPEVDRLARRIARRVGPWPALRRR